MDPDMNKYDLEHVCTGHPKMTPEEFSDIYRRAWDAFYTPEHVETLMRRAAASGMRPRRIMRTALWFYGCHAFEKVHPLQGGIIRRKYRSDRRPTMPLESPFTFYPRFIWGFVRKHCQIAKLYWRYSRALARVERDPGRFDYMDISLSPIEEHDMDEMELFTATESSQAAVTKFRKQRDSRSAKVTTAA
jgi:hypothetical protein